MKKTKYFINLGLLGMISLSSCGGNFSMEKEFNQFTKLYESSYDTSFQDIKRDTTKALYGYAKNNQQGHNSWFYECGDIKNPKLLQYDIETNSFKSNDAYFKNEMVYINNTNAIRKYVSRISGKVIIYGNLKSLNSKSSSTKLDIYINDENIYSNVLIQGDKNGLYFEIETDLKVGQEVRFVLNAEESLVVFDPTITAKNTQNTTLYHKNDIDKYYGDVFPYYDVELHKLIMWYLYSDNCLVEYNHAIDVFDNLVKAKTYEEANNYELYRYHYEKYFLSQIYDVNRFIDTKEYKVGVRDNMLYKDEENNRFLLIAGCYRQFQGMNWDSDLMIYASDDDMALSWSKPGNPVRLKYTKNLPECPSLLKIGNRWYVFVSESHVTAHQIGALKYWVGDENVDCMDMDWQNAKSYYLDGEDLCAARPTMVGDKPYMWGWITSDYKGVPLSPWAGYLNLPRQIVQREDGSLGGRMDEGLLDFINYGNVYTLNKDNYSFIRGSGTYIKDHGLKVNDAVNEVLLSPNNKRNLVQFDVDMTNSDKVSYQMVQNKKRYNCSIVKENNDVFMEITSPDEDQHKTNSKIKIHNPSKDNKYRIKLVIDGPIFEFFVNEDNALTGSTNMKGLNYDAYLVSEGEAIFTNVRINRLRPYFDC